MLKRARVGGKTPDRLLDEAEKVLAGDSKGPELKTDAAMFRSHLDNLMAEGHDMPPLYAGYAVVKAVFTLFEDEEFDPEKIEYNEIDASRDAYHLDASYLAASAYARGSAGEPGADAAKRLEFWEWWLTEAVPELWE
jgi:hypothetical protein